MEKACRTPSKYIKEMSSGETHCGVVLLLSFRLPAHQFQEGIFRFETTSIVLAKRWPKLLQDPLEQGPDCASSDRAAQHSRPLYGIVQHSALKASSVPQD